MSDKEAVIASYNGLSSFWRETITGASADLSFAELKIDSGGCENKKVGILIYIHKLTWVMTKLTMR